MRRTMVFFAALISAHSAAAQKVPKIDSLLITLPIAKAAGIERTLEAFARVGMTPTNSTPSIIEADLGEKSASLGMHTAKRWVRAIVFGTDSTANVLLRGEEVRYGSTGAVIRRLHIDNRAGGDGGKAWAMMVAVAKLLDSTQVPAAAIRP